VSTHSKYISFITISAVAVILIILLPDVMPPGKDIWFPVGLGSGRLLQTRIEQGFILYRNYQLNEIDLLSIKSTPVQILMFYLLGVFFQSFWHPFIFAWLLIGLFYTLLSITIYVLSFELTNDSFIALTSSILSLLSVGQLSLVVRINLGESIGLLFMLISLISYVHFLRSGNKRYYILTILMCISTLFTHQQPIAIFFSIVILNQTLSFFMTRSFGKWLKSTTMLGTLIFTVGLVYVLYGMVIRPFEAPIPLQGTLVPVGTLNFKGGEMVKILGYAPIALSVFGVLLGWRKTNKIGYMLLLSWMLVGFIYPNQVALGLGIEAAPPSGRLFQEFYAIVNIMASLGLYCLVDEAHLLYRSKRVHLKWVATCLLITFVAMPSTMGYITDPTFTSIYPFERIYTHEQYEALCWLEENVSPKNAVVLAEHNYGPFISTHTSFKVLRLSSASLSSFAGSFEHTDVERLENALTRVIEYWFSIGHDIILIISKNMLNIDVAPVFEEIYKNSEVKIFKGTPQFKADVGPTIKVVFDSTIEEVSTYLSGNGPLNVSYMLNLHGSESYRLLDIPPFFIIGRITPSPKYYLVNGSEIYIYGDNITDYVVSFKGHVTYSSIGWKDDFFSANWIPLEASNNKYSVGEGILNISKTFEFYKRSEQFWLEKTIRVDGSLHPYFIIRSKGDGQAKLQVVLESTDKKCFNLLPVYPTSSEWTITVIKINPYIFDKIRLGINDFEMDIGGTHSVLVDYMMFSQYSQRPAYPWLEYYSAGKDLIVDTSWHDNHGLLRPNATTGPQFVKGKFGQALLFEGKGDHVEIPHSASLSFEAGDEITISLWAKPDTVDFYRTFISKRTGPANYALRIKEGKVDFYYRNSVNAAWNSFITTDACAEVGKWKHFAVTYTFGVGNTVRIYVNGINVSGEWWTGSGCDPPFSSSVPVRIGAVGGLEQLFEGTIDGVRIYDRALSPVEIQDLMKGNPIRSGLVGEWLFDSSVSS